MLFQELNGHSRSAGASSGPIVGFDETRECTLPLPTRIAVIGNYLPRECGIATFTTDLCTAVAAEFGEGRLFAIPVNDPDSSYEYPEQVRLEIAQEDIASYERAADFLNFNSNDLVCLQHEYGIYGGTAGRHILALLRRLKMPIVTTLHTVLREPDANQRLVLEEIAQLSDRLIVMSQLAAQLLREVYAVPAGKIDVIPHGVPDLPFIDPNYFKDRFGTEGKSVLLTFGLLSPNKGIENVIRALPMILARHPHVIYIVSGVTHPHIRRREGERYREGLQALAEELGVTSHLILNNRFVSAEELVRTCRRGPTCTSRPTGKKRRSFSGTLAIASLEPGKSNHLHALLACVKGVGWRNAEASWCPSIVQTQSAKPSLRYWITMGSGMRCANGLICTRAEPHGRRPREHTWRVSSVRASSDHYSREPHYRTMTSCSEPPPERFSLS